MAGEIITRLLGRLRKTAEALPDKRKAGNGRKYEMADFLLSAFAVFYFQRPSLPDFQKAMEEREKRNNLKDAVRGGEYTRRRPGKENTGRDRAERTVPRI
jgi:hypothetical protein